jgi:hypothetical protein|tara:strand:+ start:5505 stop:5606 length:102 start_codon:yes stop_codon:yes gene_type:complete
VLVVDIYGKNVICGIVVALLFTNDGLLTQGKLT